VDECKPLLLGQYANYAERSIAASRLATRLRELASMNDSRKLIAYLESGANPDHLEKVGPGLADIGSERIR